jgi:hypothetical protein
MFISTFAIGLGPIPYVYPNEVFTIDMRPVALSISMLANWLCNTCKYSLLMTTVNIKYDTNFVYIVVTAFFPILRSMLGGFVFLFFCFCCSLAFVLFWYKVSVLCVDYYVRELIFDIYFRCLRRNARNFLKSKYFGNNS